MSVRGSPGPPLSDHGHWEETEGSLRWGAPYSYRWVENISDNDRRWNERLPSKFEALPWWRKILCVLHICQGVFDGHGWDGGYHCKHCWRNWP